MKHIILFVILVLPLVVNGQEVKEEVKEVPKTQKIKYKESGRIDFESLLIEGERKKPEMSVITGNIGEKDNGLMVFRTNFQDMMANDFGEVVE